jgi:hypothetical protein
MGHLKEYLITGESSDDFHLLGILDIVAASMLTPFLFFFWRYWGLNSGATP